MRKRRVIEDQRGALTLGRVVQLDNSISMPRSLVVIFTVLLLFGCGQKGALYLPTSQSEEQTAKSVIERSGSESLPSDERAQPTEAQKPRATSQFAAQ